MEQNIQSLLQSHHQKTSNIISNILSDEKELFVYSEYANKTISNYYEWSFIQLLLFNNVNKTDKHDFILAASELILMAAYIKDDVLDNTSIRNKAPTLAKKYGDGIAGLISDYLFTKGVSIIYNEVSSLKGDKVACEIQKDIIRGYNDCVKGQILSSLVKIEQNILEQALNVISLKTVSILQSLLSIPAKMYNADLCFEYCKFAQHIGFSLQILNDIVDIVGEDKIVGKPILEDLTNHQINIVLAYYIKYVDGNVDNVFTTCWKNSVINTDIQNNVISILNKTCALANSYNLFYDYVEKLLNSIQLVEDTKSRYLLLKYSKYILNI